jgi:hypothetical protein
MPHADNNEDGDNRRFDNLLNKYYDAVILSLHDNDELFIMGPGEAKVELQKRMEDKALPMHIVDIETADTMSNGQLIAKVQPTG